MAICDIVVTTKVADVFFFLLCYIYINYSNRAYDPNIWQLRKKSFILSAAESEREEERDKE
jgi:hypothetical protein